MLAVHITVLTMLSARMLRIPLYRAVDLDELDDIRLRGKFLTTSKSMAGKWFAETPFDAAEWGRRFHQWSQIPFFVVRVDVPEWVAEQMFRLDNLDDIGAARWASEGDILDQINSTNSGMMELPTIALR